jgi:predicted nucleic acid-binding protein
VAAVIIDTGPLVAFLCRDDGHHGWVTAQLALVEPPLLTCESVLSEAAFLLRRVGRGADALLALVRRKLVRVPFQLEAELPAVDRLMARYANVPISLADACLVRMSETHAGSVVVTLDGDFRTYRRHGRNVIPLIAPPGR